MARGKMYVIAAQPASGAGIGKAFKKLNVAAAKTVSGIEEGKAALSRGKALLAAPSAASGAGISSVFKKINVGANKVIKGLEGSKAALSKATSLASVPMESGAGISTVFKKINVGANKVIKGLEGSKAALSKATTLAESGSGRDANPWIAHVRAWQAENGGTWKQALTGAKSSYRPAKASGGGKKKR